MACKNVVQFNPSTLKVSYNSATNKAIAGICDCVYDGNDSDHFPAGQTPTKLCLTFSGIRKCSDNSLWVGLNKAHCVVRDGVTDNWINIVTIDGVDLQLRANVHIGLIEVYLADLSAAYFEKDGEDVTCGEIQAANGLLIEHCNGTVLGYGGNAATVNPCAPCV